MFRLSPRSAAGAMALALIVVAAPASAQVIGKFDRSLNVSGPVTLSLTSGSGSVNVVAGGDRSVHVVGTIRGNTWRHSADRVERAARAVEAKPPIVQNGSTISLGALEDEEISQFISISWEVTVPKQTSVTVKTGSGSQAIASLA